MLRVGCQMIANKLSVAPAKRVLVLIRTCVVMFTIFSRVVTFQDFHNLVNFLSVLANPSVVLFVFQPS